MRLRLGRVPARLGPSRRGVSDAAVRGALDSPQATTLHRVPTRFSGWALIGSDLPTSVSVRVGEHTPFTASLGKPRWDVAVQLGDPSVPATCGWATTIDLSDVAEGAVSVEIVVEDRNGRRSTMVRRSYEMRAAGLDGVIDEPRQGATLWEDLLVVRGWATDGPTLPSRLEVTIDGVTAGRARLRLPYVHSGSGTEDVSLSGFECHLDLSATDRIGELAVAVRSQTGAYGGVIGPVAARRAPHDDVSPGNQRARVLADRTRGAVAALNVRRHDVPTDSLGHLVVFAHDFALAGAQVYLAGVLQHLVRHTRKCTVVASRDGPTRQRLEALGVETVVTGQEFATDVETYEGQVRTLTMLAVSARADAIMVNTLEAAPAADAAERLGVPVLWSVHESYTPREWLWFRANNRLVDPYILHRLLAALKGADRLVFASRATAEIFSRYTATDRVSVVPYGLDLDSIDAFARSFDRRVARAQHRFDEDALLFVTVGTVSERKAQACAVEAFTRVAPAHPGVAFAVVGDIPTPYSAAVHRMAETSPVADRIRIEPLTTDVLPWYGMGDILLAAGDIESLPITVLEAMALGLPALSTNIFGIPEVIVDGKNGWLVESRDIDALVAAIERVLSTTHKERRAAGDAARELIHRNHRDTDYATSLLGLLRDARGGR